MAFWSMDDMELTCSVALEIEESRTSGFEKAVLKLIDERCCVVWGEELAHRFDLFSGLGWGELETLKPEDNVEA